MGGGALAGAGASAMTAGLAAAAGAGLGNAAGQLIETGEVDPKKALLAGAGAGLSSGFAGAMPTPPGGDAALAAYPDMVAQGAGQAGQAGFLDQAMQGAGQLGNQYFNNGLGMVPAMMQFSAGTPSEKWLQDEARNAESADANSQKDAYVNKYLIPTLQKAGIPRENWSRYGFGYGYQDGGVNLPPTDELAWEEAYPGKAFSPANMVMMGERKKGSPKQQIQGAMGNYMPADRQAQLEDMLFGANFEQKLQQSFLNPDTKLLPGDYQAAFRYVTGRAPSQEELAQLQKSTTQGGRMDAWSFMKQAQRKDEVQRMLNSNPDVPGLPAGDRLGAVAPYIKEQRAAIDARQNMSGKAKSGYADGGVTGANLGLAVPDAGMQIGAQQQSREMQKLFDMLVIALSGELPPDQAQMVIQLATQVLGPEAVAEAQRAVTGQQGGDGRVVAGQPSPTDNVMAQDANTGEPIKLASGEAILPTPMVEAAGGGLAGAKAIVGAAAQNMPQLQPHADRFMRAAHA